MLTVVLHLLAMCFFYSDSLFKHAGPVWQVEWIAKDRSFGEDRAEVLVSVGTDGRVLQWTLRKGLESIQLMRLKRLHYPKPAEKKVLSVTKAQKIQSKQKLMKPQKKNQQEQQQQQQQEANITQFAPGMGFAFDKSDSNMYVSCSILHCASYASIIHLQHFLL